MSSLLLPIIIIVVAFAAWFVYEVRTAPLASELWPELGWDEWDDDAILEDEVVRHLHRPSPGVEQILRPYDWEAPDAA